MAKIAAHFAEIKRDRNMLTKSGEKNSLNQVSLFLSLSGILQTLMDQFSEN